MANTAFTIANVLNPNATSQTTQTTQSAFGRGISKTNFRYPYAMLDSNNMDYLLIKILEFEAPQFSLDQFQGTKVNFDLEEISNIKNKKLLYTIALPVPASVSDSNAASWGEDRLGPLEVFGLGAAGTAIKNPDLSKGISGVINSVVNSGSSLMKNANAQKAVQAYMAGAAVAAARGNTTGQGVLTRATGSVLNTNQELLFQGPTLRGFNFNFDFTPRDENEAEEVRQIIRVFKQSMAARKNAPTSVQGLFLGSPHVFDLTYKSGRSDHPFLNKFKRCALAGMGVNYNASGSYSTYYDGTPVHMNMTLEFQELNPVYNEDYNTNKGQGGVGY